VGIYLLDGLLVIDRLEDMARHPASTFRAAAAMAMGRALDEHFVPLLNSMVKDANADVRCAALRGLVAIRRKAAQPPITEEPDTVNGAGIQPEAPAPSADTLTAATDTGSASGDPELEPREPGIEEEEQDAIDEVPAAPDR
jgi:hypothetical protein